MSFEEKLAFGKAGESVVARYLRSRGNTVLPASASLPDPEPPDTRSPSQAAAATIRCTPGGPLGSSSA